LIKGSTSSDKSLRKFDGKLLVKPAKRNTRALLEKVRGIINANKSASQINLIHWLNPVIRGWMGMGRNCHLILLSQPGFSNNQA